MKNKFKGKLKFTQKTKLIKNCLLICHNLIVKILNFKIKKKYVFLENLLFGEKNIKMLQ